MTVVLRIGDRTITEAEIIPLLASYQLLPRLLFELIVDDEYHQSSAWQDS